MIIRTYIQKTLLACIVCACFFAAYSNASASTLQYGTFLGVKNDTVAIRYNDTEIKTYYLCNIETFACKNTTATEAATYSFSWTAASAEQKARLQIPSDFGELKMSPSGQFTAYYVPAWFDKKKLGSFTFMDGTKKYTFKGSTSYWDLLYGHTRPLLAFSPDNSYLAYINDIQGAPSLYIKKLATLSKTSVQGTPITDGTYTVGTFMFWDAHTIFFTGNKNNPYSWSLFSYDTETGVTVEKIQNVSYDATLRKIGNHLGFVQLKDKAAVPSLYTIADGSIHELIPSQMPVPAKYDTSNNQIITVGNLTAAVLVPKQNYDMAIPRPLIIWLHGGPYRQTANGYHPYLSYAGYDWMLEEARNAGALVAKLDYTGSFGYGKATGNGLEKFVGDRDVKDVQNTVQFFKDNNIAVSKVYLVGNSYGGYLALRSITEKPNSYDGVLSINGVTDWGTLLEHLKIENSIFKAYFNGTPNKSNKKMYDKASIFKRIGNLHDEPIIIAQAASDYTVNPEQATLLYEKLKLNKKNATLVMYAGEDHVFTKKSSIKDLCLQLFALAELQKEGRCNFE